MYTSTEEYWQQEELSEGIPGKEVTEKIKTEGFKYSRRRKKQ